MKEEIEIYIFKQNSINLKNRLPYYKNIENFDYSQWVLTR